MKEITLEAKIENVPVVTDFINAELENADCPMKVQMQIDIAVDEIFGNIANYAYGEKTGNATVKVGVSGNSAVISFIDSGQPYNPLEHADPDTTLSADERQIGGLGIFIVKKSMDDLGYEFKDGKNILTITKKM